MGAEGRPDTGLARPRGIAGGEPFVLALGSNLGDRSENLKGGLTYLGRELRLQAVSRVVESEAWGPVPQGAYLNLVVRGVTAKTPAQVLDLALAAERHCGRVRRERFGPRTLDVDIILFGDVVMESSVLTIPHPRWMERPFVRALLQDVAEGLEDPRTGRSLAELAPPGPLPPGLTEVARIDPPTGTEGTTS